MPALPPLDKLQGTLHPLTLLTRYHVLGHCVEARVVLPSISTPSEQLLTRHPHLILTYIARSAPSGLVIRNTAPSNPFYPLPFSQCPRTLY